MPARSSSILVDAAIVRSATLAGKWSYVELPVQIVLSKAGKNIIEIQMGQENVLNGYLYVSVLLEWA